MIKISIRFHFSFVNEVRVALGLTQIWIEKWSFGNGVKKMVSEARIRVQCKKKYLKMKQAGKNASMVLMYICRS